MRKIFALICILILAGCAAKSKPVGYPCEAAPRLKAKWYNNGASYQMRHEGVLQFGSMTIPMTGLMKLDTENGTAKVAILTSMGIKMLVLNINKDDHEVLFASPAAKQIPGFMDGSVNAIRRVFLSPFPGWPDSCTEVDMVQHNVEENPDGTLRTRMPRQTWDLLSKEMDDWRVEYSENTEIEGLRIPEEIRYEDRPGRFTVTLKLVSVKRI